jgi:hypothetical protein
MSENDSKRDGPSAKGQKFHKTILNDLRQPDFRRTLRQDLEDIYNFYIDQVSRDRLRAMGRFRRWITLVIWLLKGMILKLTPVRRVLLVASIVMILIGPRQQNGALPFCAFILLLLILMFELKDKLLARDELASGRAVQMALIPDHNPTLPGWDIWLYTRPANEVGGDLVDYLDIPSKGLGLALGDVAGKGLGAALLMAKLQATLRALAPGFSSLAELGARMNEILLRDGPRNHFASLVYLQLSAHSGRVRILNAGHYPPFILRRDRIEEMEKGGSALGLLVDEIYVEQCIELHENDVLVAYSDGLVEALNETSEFFGHERLVDLFPKVQVASAESVGTRLLDEVGAFVGHANQSDDLSLLVVKRLG